MKTIAIAVQKGGSGKTTIAVHLAVAAQQAGLRVALADTDPQGSAKGGLKPASIPRLKWWPSLLPTSAQRSRPQPRKAMTC